MAPAEHRRRRRPSPEPQPPRLPPTAARAARDLRDARVRATSSPHDVACSRSARTHAHRARRYWRGVTASDVRAQWQRLCVRAAFRRVIEGSRNHVMASGRPSRLSAARKRNAPLPNDSRNGSNRRALTALLESWVNDSRDQALPRGSAIAMPSKRRAAPASSTSTAHNGSGVPCSGVPLRLPLVPQASRTLTGREIHQGSKNKRSTTILAALMKGNERRHGCAI